MQASELRRAVSAARATASALDLTVDDAIVLQDANRVALRLMPCDVVARVAPMEYRASAEFEVELAQRLAETGSPVAALEPRVEPRVYVREGFVMNMWTYYESVPPREVPPTDYAHALERLHAGMRQIDLATPHFTDRIAEAQHIVGSREESPALADADRELLGNTLRSSRRAIGDRRAAEQLLHGEPHPWNLLGTTRDLLFIDLETCCRGPVEFDIAHVPDDVSEHYPNADQDLLRECRGLILAMVAAWRWRSDDNHPNGRRHGRELLSALREGPPWPTLDVMDRRAGSP
jgi:Ser/Thr protein kinase RdoA (MazF antagonist)